MFFLTVKKVHYSPGNEWGDTHDAPAIEQLILCKEENQMSTKWLFVKNFIAHVQPLNVLSLSFLCFSLEETQPPLFP